MKSITVKKSIVTAVLSVGLLMSVSVSVSAETSNVENPVSTVVSKIDVNAIQQGFEKNGVDKATQEKLLEKIKNGELLDSMNPEKAKDGVTTTTRPKVSVKSTNTPAGFSSKTVFPDGSYITVSVTPPSSTSNDGGMSTQDVTPGPGTVCGSGYCAIRDAKVKWDNGVVSAYFLADYTFAYGTGGYDTINRVYQPSVYCLAGSYSDLSGPTIIRATETYYQSAKASISWKYSTKLGDTLQYLILDVQNDKATSSSA
ncbi:hypothetical protein [Paenibacillus sp. SN-8-1]|uniref:hypothetical protein n=1 Tax=Paenibacillus sp. SN-8-1 TaxID=3435409 RepID=UPI003D9A917D